MAPWLWASMEVILQLGALRFTEGALVVEHASSTEGVSVILTDLNKSNHTDFVLGDPAFTAMARNGKEQELKKLGILDVEYESRCSSGTEPPQIRLLFAATHDRSRSIVSTGVSYLLLRCVVLTRQVGSPDWRFMRREYGPVWSIRRAPVGPLQLRMVVTGGYGGRWVWAQKAVLPAEWTTGSVYDLGVQITDIAREGCRMQEYK
ncbi:hypothetical protein B296_00020650 [Ensete ventricosum]|uniref:Expansin-like CBD domain-containing protein n=1 Tax=Ensete ventricosum TaxID=4639 RepID=A0A426ZDZ1_ENSVE|nr:hypothetical protein B296_00020650 [Ensete ventricosum]